MLGKWFNRGEWQDDRIEIANGSAGTVSVTLRNAPCRREVNKRTLRYIDPEFGHDLMVELARDHLADHQQVAAKLGCGEIVKVQFAKPEFREMELEIRASSVEQDSKQFLSEILDAIINAFESVGLKP